MQCEWLTQLNKKMIQQRLKHADLVISCCDYITNKIKKAFPRTPCITVHNGTNINHFVPEKNKGKQLLFVGRISPEKGLHVLLDAFNNILKQHPEAKLKIIGPKRLAPKEFIINLSNDPQVRDLSKFYSGDYLNYLQKISNQVSFTGSISHNELADHYRTADIFISPSVWQEPFPQTVLEAMASGLPVIASKAGGHPESIEHGKTGLLVERGDANALSEAINTLLADEDLRNSMGEAGRQRAVEHFSHETIAENLLTQYKKLLKKTCPCCNASETENFYEVKGVPVNSVLLLSTKKKALKIPKGDIALGFCNNCGFIFNTLFDQKIVEYSSDYNPSQASSPTFNKFHKKLAEYLIEKYDLRNKKIIEVGCGEGEFLTLLCQLGNNQGIGFDPAYTGEDKDNIKFIKDFYSEKYADHKADFLCCKMTLEHIHNPADFVSMIRKAIGDADTTVFFQVPDVTRVLKEGAFWDIYYEHCSYFGPASLSSLFERSGFNVLDIWKVYDGQYLMITARPGDTAYNDPEIKQDTTEFIKKYQELANKFKDIIKNNHKVVLWGGGSKGVTFLTTLHKDQIEYVVDIDQKKQGTFMAGTGQKIVPPKFLKQYNPDVVIIMNPVYKEEIQTKLNNLDVQPQILTVP